MATIFVHIGTHKTGTTSLQYFFKLNYLSLLESGYLYPQSGRVKPYNFAHHGLAWQILGQRILRKSSDSSNSTIPEWLEVYWEAKEEIILKSIGRSLKLENEWEKLTVEINEKAIDNIIWLSSDLCDNRTNGEHLEKIDYGLSTRFIA